MYVEVYKREGEGREGREEIKRKGSLRERMRTCMDDGPRTMCGTVSLLPPCRSQGSKSGQQVWLQVSLSADPSCQVPDGFVITFFKAFIIV